MNGARLAIDGEMTIYTVDALKAQLLAAMPADGHLTLDLAAVGMADSAGLQLLLAAGREAEARGGALALAAPSAVLRELLALAGVTDRFASAPEPAAGVEPIPAAPAAEPAAEEIAP
ncbi:STAS domain-containing protein [Derxia lacustris]|uniref:STAS domain-containing protein n=1 Tax=Derxia lacustris TaxID=764842 RepID=UPI000A16E3EF|nr:STAS domain-containing protein [Derxia lacustris]